MTSTPPPTPPPDEPPPRPLRRDARANRDRILAAAAEVLSSTGAGAPLEAIAERAGVGIGTLYRRFPSREALMAALVEQETERLAGLALAPGTADPWQDFVRFFGNVLGSPIANIVMRQAMVAGAPAQVLERRLLQVVLPAVGALLARARDAGAVRQDIAPTDMPLLAMAISAVARETGSEAARQRVLGIVLAGLRPSADGALSAPPLDGQILLHTVLASAGREPPAPPAAP